MAHHLQVLGSNPCRNQQLKGIIHAFTTQWAASFQRGGSVWKTVKAMLITYIDHNTRSTTWFSPVTRNTAGLAASSVITLVAFFSCEALSPFPTWLVQTSQRNPFFIARARGSHPTRSRWASDPAGLHAAGPSPFPTLMDSLSSHLGTCRAVTSRRPWHGSFATRGTERVEHMDCV